MIKSPVVYEQYKDLKKSLVSLAFFDGLLASHHLSFYFLYTTAYDIPLLTYSIFEFIVTFLFCLNPFSGYLADTYPLFGYKRKSYIFLIGLVPAICYVIVSLTYFFPINIMFIFALHIMIDASHSFRAVLTDSLSVTLNNYKKEAFYETEVNQGTNTVASINAYRFLGRVLSNSLFCLIHKYLEQTCKIIRLSIPNCDLYMYHFYCC